MKRVISIAIFLCCAIGAAQDRYFFYMFGYGKIPPAKNIHTFALFARTNNPGGVAEWVSISWSPWDAEPHIVGVVPGKNFSFDDTMRNAESRLITRWGPIEIPENFFEAARDQARFLDSGNVFYKWIDGILPREIKRYRVPAINRELGGAVNCIHAVSDIGGVLITTGLLSGVNVGPVVLEHLLNLWNVSVTAPIKVVTEPAFELSEEKLAQEVVGP